MEDEVKQLSIKLNALRKAHKMPHWCFVYGDKLLERIGEYLLVDRIPEAKILIKKLYQWIDEHDVDEKSNYVFKNERMIFWNKELLAPIVEKLRETLSLKGMLVPALERNSIQFRLKNVNQLIENKEYQKAYEELHVIRNSFINRLRRSFRARISNTYAYKHGSQPDGTLIGPYNAEHTLEETMHIVGERDPIWVEDFFEIYNELFRITERLVPPSKK